MAGNDHITIKKVSSPTHKITFTNKSQANAAVVFYGDPGHEYGVEKNLGQDITHTAISYLPMPKFTSLPEVNDNYTQTYTATLLATNTSDGGKKIDTKTTTKNYTVNYKVTSVTKADLRPAVTINGTNIIDKTLVVELQVTGANL